MTTFGPRIASNGVSYKAARGFRGRAQPSPTRNVWLRQVFDEQDRLGITNQTLARMSGMDVRTVNKLRQAGSDGKRPTFDQVVNLLEAMDFKFPEKLTKNGG